MADDLIGTLILLAVIVIGGLIALWVSGMWKPALPAFLTKVTNKGS